MDCGFTSLDHESLMARLGGVEGPRITVVTPNRRLARTVRSAFDARRAGAGLAAWESADVLPWDAFVERLWEDALYTQPGVELPLLMTGAQEQAVWEEAVRGSALGTSLLSAPATATRAREAWRLAHAWRLLPAMRSFPLHEDARAFLDWAARFERVTAQRGLTDRARLAERVAQVLAPALDSQLVLYGFDLLTPQVRELVALLARAGVGIAQCGPPRVASSARRVELATAHDEYRAAARWARARLEAHAGARIGIVVPDLGRSRDALERAFRAVLHPGATLPGAPAQAPAFDVSLGRPLADFPLVSDALAILALLAGEVDFTLASRIVRSPFVFAAEREAQRRARLDARLRERSGARVDLDGLVRLVGPAEASPAPLLVERLARLAALRRGGWLESKTASAWASACAEALRTLGFPGERALDSAEYQTLEKWHEALAAFGAVERVAGRMRFAEAAARIAHVARETVFQPETPDAPITIVGVLESAGLAFDHLWVMGLTEEAWPLPVRPNPFVPVRLQREAGVPQADAASSLALDRRITQGWLAAAGEVVLSHARIHGDVELAPSPLVSAMAASDGAGLGVPAYATLVESIHARRAVERVRDGVAPPIVDARHPGGTRLFQDQAACPFRAYARNRLASAPLGTPQPGLDAAERGTLLHHVLARVWQALGTRAALAAMGEADLEALLRSAAEDAIAKVRRRRPEALQGRFAALERERLVALARAWLAFELGRRDFEVVATERATQIAFGGVTVRGKLDRLDRLHDGRFAVLDYKTGSAALASWFPPRPEEPQLPMYALAVPEPIDAIAFARVRPGALELCGLARDEGLLPKVGPIGKNRSRQARDFAGWDALKAAWAQELKVLGEAFAGGDARVDPKRGEQTCRRCDQQIFCRIAEKIPGIDAGLEGDESESDE